MKNLPLLGQTIKFAGISISAIAALGVTSCITPSEKEFKAQHGFKRSDFFGKRNSEFVPRAARKLGETYHHSPGADSPSEESTAGLSIK
ncbi:hypothetical protein OVA24_20655 [Luteolibacter sp. SL250]|uniref:hypothetical protein n=1 Tax=Luteolibacter sp. SL250 TaxID=2995170 RepID=UPI00227130F7|nr:hypothetical protein [Luteolibacter sp. SL250]WAC19634.1 hypothetical protein OVA24_20655 [Luteolibacter sp. SL250]